MTSLVKGDVAGNPEERETDLGGKVMVTFFTTTFAKAMPEQTFLVPLHTLPDGLNKLVESVLEVEGQRFDFLYKDEYISTSLEKFLNRRGISHEELLNIEYTPALEAEEGSLLPHDDWVSSVRAPVLGSADFLLTGSYDHCVRVWEGEACLAVGAQHTACVKEVCVHPVAPPAPSASDVPLSKKRPRGSARAAFDCVSCGDDGRVFAWRFDPSALALRPLGSLRAHAASVDSVAVSPGDGALLATASWDRTVRVFEFSQLLRPAEAAEAAPLVSFADHSRAVLSCRFSAARGAARLFAAGLDGAVKALDVEPVAVAAELRGDHAVRGIAVRPAGAADLVLAAATDSRARLYDTRARDAVRTFSGHRQWLYAAAWIADSREGGEGGNAQTFATAAEDSTVRIWDLRSSAAPLLTLDTLHTDGVLDVAYAGESQIVSCGKDNKTRSFTLSSEKAF